MNKYAFMAKYVSSFIESRCKWLRFNPLIMSGNILIRDSFTIMNNGLKKHLVFVFELTGEEKYFRLGNKFKIPQDKRFKGKNIFAKFLANFNQKGKKSDSIINFNLQNFETWTNAKWIPKIYDMIEGGEGIFGILMKNVVWHLRNWNKQGSQMPQPIIYAS